ncbi:MAG TPA: ATP-binding protein, partial [Ideonella sp.]|nr:ATP-binding protein [Ideonella sp.]
RREAFYTNLSPGSYRFSVRAANDDGVWNDAGASLSFTVLPAFWQTWWFRLLCVPLVAGLLWVLYQLRLRVVAERLSDRLQARMIERERIARELHDTLLQSVQGLILRFQSGTARLAPDDPVRMALGKALDRAEQVLEEGRDRVNDLRLQPPGERDLAQGLERLAVELTEQVAERVDAEPPEFSLHQQGEPRPLRPGVHEELYRLGREALVNAYTHARAHHIALRLQWGDDALGLSVADDGCGIAPAILAAGGRAGHWGLAGMQERAADLKATLELHSEAASGTTVSLRLPAQLAYAPPAAAKPWWRWR